MYKAFLLTSGQNPKIKELVHLREKRCREESQKFLIEGYREILRASQAGYSLEALFICEELFLGSNERELIQAISRYAPIYALPEELFRRCSYRDRPDGLLATAPIKHPTLTEFKEAIYQRAGESCLFLLIAESIEKPGNLGSILRSCDAAGVHGVILCDQRTDLFNPNVVRASIGTLFTVPVVTCHLHEAFAFLKQEDVQLVATTPHTEKLFTEQDFTNSLAIAMGSEQVGLSKEMMEAAKTHVKIPMLGAADSLNVAAATTLLLYEVVRQRGAADVHSCLI